MTHSSDNMPRNKKDICQQHHQNVNKLTLLLPDDLFLHDQP